MLTIYTVSDTLDPIVTSSGYLIMLQTRLSTTLVITTDAVAFTIGLVFIVSNDAEYVPTDNVTST
jgi:hypothetical protein